MPHTLFEYGAFFGIIFVVPTIRAASLWWVSSAFWMALGCLVYLYAGTRQKEAPQMRGRSFP